MQTYKLKELYSVPLRVEEGIGYRGWGLPPPLAKSGKHSPLKNGRLNNFISTKMSTGLKLRQRTIVGGLYVGSLM